jgi:putative hydrolase of the HAD superfamily
MFGILRYLIYPKEKPLERRVVIFDFGQVLTLNQQKQVYEPLLEELEKSSDEFFPVWGSYRHDYDQGLLNTRDYWTKVLKELNIPDYQTYVDQHWQKLLETDLSAFDNPRKEMLDYVKDLGKRGIHLGILSNMPEDVGEFWELRWDGMESFTWKIWSGDIGLIKPGKEIFQHLLNTIERNPHEVLFVDDIEANILGAKALGIDGIVFSSVNQVQNEIEHWLREA